MTTATFAGKTALVTGGTSGIGRSIARALAERGAHVYVASRSHEKVRSTIDDFKKAGLTIAGLPLDVRDRGGFRLAIDVVIRENGAIDYLFNNAGIAVLGEARDVTDQDWDDVLDVDLRGVINGIQAAYPHMIARRRGHIVNVASIGGLVPTPFAVGYTAAKFGVVGLSRALRLEAERYGVKVSVVCPAAVDTAMATASAYRHVDREKFHAVLPSRFEDCDRSVARILRDVERNVAISTPGAAGMLAWMERYAPVLVRLMMRRFCRSGARVRDAYTPAMFDSTMKRSCAR
jgi:NAD(P)-dependent dehydrogenase (short-subunit alcohol dehydrogenase family)